MALDLVIDGYNLIMRKSGNGFADLEEQREILITQLQTYKKVRRVKVTVVFDASGRPGLSRDAENIGGIRVMYSPSGVEADALIKKIAKEKREGATIVTSDNDLANYSRAVGAVVVSTEEFRNLLEIALYEDMKGVDPCEEEDFDGRGGKKGPARRLAKEARKKKKRMKKL